MSASTFLDLHCRAYPACHGALRPAVGCCEICGALVRDLFFWLARSLMSYVCWVVLIFVLIGLLAWFAVFFAWQRLNAAGTQIQFALRGV